MLQTLASFIFSGLVFSGTVTSGYDTDIPCYPGYPEGMRKGKLLLYYISPKPECR